MPSDTLWVTPQDFAKWETLLRYIFAVSFISIAPAVVKLKMFKVFFFVYRFSIHEMTPFWVFLGSYSPKYCSILLEFWPEVVSNKTNTAWKILQNFAFWLKWDTPKVYGLGPFWGLIYCQKTKNIAKNKICTKTKSLGIWHNVIPTSQKNHRMLKKLSQKTTFFGPKIGLNWPWSHTKGSSEILT